DQVGVACRAGRPVWALRPGQRDRFTAGVADVQPPVGPFGEDEPAPVRPPGPSPVLHDPVAGVPPRGEHILDPALGRTAHHAAAPTLMGPRLVPPHFVAGDLYPQRAVAHASDVDGLDCHQFPSASGSGNSGGWTMCTSPPLRV